LPRTILSQGILFQDPSRQNNSRREDASAYNINNRREDASAQNINNVEGRWKTCDYGRIQDSILLRAQRNGEAVQGLQSPHAEPFRPS